MNQKRTKRTKLFQQMCQEEQKRLLNLLKEMNASRHTYQYGDSKEETAVYYIVDSEQMEQFKQMQQEFSTKLSEQFEGKLLKKPYFHVAKLIYLEGEKIVTFAVAKQKNYKLIRDREKVLRDLEVEFIIWKNKEIKHLSDYIKSTRKITHKEEAKLFEKLMQKIEIAKEKMEYIKEHIDDLEDVFITTYPRAKIYPFIAYFTDKGRSGSSYLRTEVFNIIEYEPKRKKPRKDMIIENLLAKASNPFGDVYVIEK